MSQAGSFVNAGGGSSGVQSINTDNGTATPNTGVITIAGGTNINTEGSGSTITVNLDDSVNLSGSLSAGTDLTASGNINLPNTTSSSVGVINKGGSSFIHDFGHTSNTFVGRTAGNFTLTPGTAISNTSIGALSLRSLTTGIVNTGLGTSALSNVTTGNNNIAIGNAAGNAITTTSNNINIGNSGVVTDSGTIRIGTDGAHTRCFIAGDTTINRSLTVSDNINLSNTTSSSTGVINKGGQRFIHDFGTATSYNTFVGSFAGNFTLTSGTANLNTGIGTGSLRSLTTGAGNTGLGTSTLVNVTTGSNNIAIGNAAGNAITTTSNNINIGNSGVVTDNGTIRIGTDGAHNNCFISGSTAINGYLSATNIITAGTGLTITTGNINLPNTTSSSTGVINKVGLSFIHNFGAAVDANTFVGRTAGNFTLTPGIANLNTGIGAGSLNSLTTGAGNTGLGTSALVGVTTGNNNIAIGNAAGNVITTTSNNIHIGNSGVVTDSGTIRIGAGTHNSCFIQGIRNVTPSATDVAPVIIDTNGQLGTAPAVGSWTPVLAFGGATTGITYSFQAGSYYKIGKVIHITCTIAISSKGTATGNATIMGLPFISTNNAAVFTMANCVIALPSGATQFYGISVVGLSIIQLNAVGSSVNSNITDANFLNNTQFTLSGFYFAA